MSFLFFVRWRKEREKEKSVCWALGIQESVHREMPVFVMSLSQNISLYNKALLSERIGKILASIWFVRLVSDLSSSLVGIWNLSFLMARWGSRGGCTRWRRWWLWFHHCLTYLAVHSTECSFARAKSFPRGEQLEGSVGVFLGISADKSPPLPHPWLHPSVLNIEYWRYICRQNYIPDTGWHIAICTKYRTSNRTSYQMKNIHIFENTPRGGE